LFKGCIYIRRAKVEVPEQRNGMFLQTENTRYR
jgi:hypothetical protein